jgi:hypothetical protein
MSAIFRGKDEIYLFRKVLVLQICYNKSSKSMPWNEEKKSRFKSYFMGKRTNQNEPMNMESEVNGRYYLNYVYSTLTASLLF